MNGDGETSVFGPPGQPFVVTLHQNTTGKIPLAKVTLEDARIGARRPAPGAGHRRRALGTWPWKAPESTGFRYRASA
jgi:hypothetical protein